MKRRAVFDQYNAKLVEVGEKFKNFLAHLSREILHGSFFTHNNLAYRINVGSKEAVEVSSLLTWIKCVAQPIHPLPTSEEQQVKASGFISSVIHQVDEPAIVFRVDENEQYEKNSLDEFLSKDKHDNFIPVGSTQKVCHDSTLP